MLELAVRFPFLAFGTPGFASDEHLPGTQPNDWSRHEPHQEKRCKEPPVFPLPHPDPSVPAGKPARCNRLLRRRIRSSPIESSPIGSSDFCEDFVAEHSFSGNPRVGRRLIVLDWRAGARNLKKRASVKPHSVFLRKECILPDRLDPLREPCGDNWTIVEEITAPVLDTMIRQKGWHFMWIVGSCSRRGFGLTQENAAQRALARALAGIERRFNAAELDSIRLTRFLGLHVAKVTLQPRQVTEHSWLDALDAKHPQAVPAR